MTAIWRDGCTVRYHWDEAGGGIMGQHWAAYWRFRDQFAEVLDPERYSLEWLDGQVMSGTFKVWASANAAIIAKIEAYPTGAMDIHGLLAAGDLSEIVDTLIPQAEAWGRAVGCIGAKIESRAGWVRALKQSGWEIHQTTLRKVL